jgi:uncharacterized protein (UPF0332 family)
MAWTCDPEATLFIERANIVLGRAGVMLEAGLNEDSAWAAYIASFHVAQAYIFERTGKAFKTHRGVRQEFFRLTQADGRTDPELRRFLARAYEFKSVADYFSGPNPVISQDEAEEAIRTARHFVAHFAQYVSLPNAAPARDVPD